MSPNRRITINAFCTILFSLISQTNAQDQLTVLGKGVPTTGCVGNNAVGTATYKTNLELPTGQIQIEQGDYWKQAGAVWEFSTDTEGLGLSNAYVPGAGAGFGGAGVPAEINDAFKLSDDKKTITFAIPSQVDSTYSIYFEAVGAAEASSLAQGTETKEAPSPTWTEGACKVTTIKETPVTCSGSVQEPASPSKTACACPSDILLLTLSGGDDPCSSYTGSQGDLITSLNSCPKPVEEAPAKRWADPPEPIITPAPAGPPVGAKFRPKRSPAEVAKPIAKRQPGRMQLQPRQGDAGKVNIIIKGSVPCLGPPEPSATGDDAPNPTVVSLCTNNQITPGAGSWSTYEVPKYMASLLTANAPPNETPALMNGAQVIKDDVNPGGAVCTYTSKCQAPTCPGVKEPTSGALAVQRYLGYTAVANFNNYLYSVYDGVFNAGSLGDLVSGDIVKTFFTNPTPDATWMQILGIFTPLLGMFSAMLGPFSAVGSAALGVAGGIAGAVGAIGTIAELQPVADKRLDEDWSIEKFIGDYLKATVVGLEKAYDDNIGKGTAAFDWSGSPVAPEGQRNGLFGDGIFANSDYSQGLTDNLLEKVTTIFTYKAINFAWIDSGVFIMYVPYGRDVKGPDGKIIAGGINQDYCNNDLKSKDDIGTLTICDAPGGMARMYNAAGGGDSGTLTTPQGFDKGFEVLPGQKLSVAGAIKGSVASWKAGDFGYDASNPYQDAFNSESGLSADQAIEISKLEIKEDTAGFFNVPVCQTWDLRFFPPASGSKCNACGSKVAVGGKEGSTVKFMDKANDVVKDTLAAAVKTYCGGYYGTSCSNPCPGDVYSG